MNDEATQPPHQPNTARNILHRGWIATTAAIAAHPDIALIVFLALFVGAVIL